MNKSVSGIKSGNNRSIRNIDAGGNDNKPTPPHDSATSYSPENKPPRQSRNQTIASIGMWFTGFIAILLIFFLFSVIFAQTTVTVTPRTAPVSVDSSFTAVPSDTATGTARKLTYSLTTAKKTASRIVRSTATEYKEKKATGKITIYNNFSSGSMRFVDNTRFQGPNGRIYRAQSPVAIPGTQDGKPGTVTIQVIADQPGSQYNLSGDVRFSIPGLKGTPQEDAVYARLASPIDGGIAKEVPRVSSSTQKQVVSDLKDGLKQSVIQQVKGKAGKGQIIYGGGIFFSVETSSQKTSEDKATINVTGTAHAITFNVRELAIYLANQSGIDVSADTNITLEDPRDFNVRFDDKQSISPANKQPIDVAFSGNSRIIWKYNKQALARDLRGLRKSQVKEVLDNYQAIQKAKVNTRPFWKRSLPTNTKEITITSTLE